MRKSWKVVLVLGSAGILAYAWEEREAPIPVAGTYRIQDAKPLLQPTMLISAVGEVAVFQVVDQGPREWAEIVVENWEGPVLTSTRNRVCCSDSSTNSPLPQLVRRPAPSSACRASTTPSPNPSRS